MESAGSPLIEDSMRMTYTIPVIGNASWEIYIGSAQSVTQPSEIGRTENTRQCQFRHGVSYY